NAGSWPKEWLIPDDVKASIVIHYYIAIGLGALAIIFLAVGIPLCVKKLHKGGRVAAPKAKKKK
ncbi:MAG: hypothetical protein MJ199_02630, partial [Bacilli bacterium]|nr:hypothetical protein [Bacilli bacterium]